jgi:hypothetical protein
VFGKSGEELDQKTMLPANIIKLKGTPKTLVRIKFYVNSKGHASEMNGRIGLEDPCPASPSGRNVRPGEVIVGIYGTFNNFIRTLGFILWSRQSE